MPEGKGSRYRGSGGLRSSVEPAGRRHRNRQVGEGPDRLDRRLDGAGVGLEVHKLHLLRLLVVLIPKRVMQPGLKPLAQGFFLDLDEPVAAPDQDGAGIAMQGSRRIVRVELLDECRGGRHRLFWRQNQTSCFRVALAERNHAFGVTRDAVIDILDDGAALRRAPRLILRGHLLQRLVDRRLAVGLRAVLLVPLVPHQARAAEHPVDLPGILGVERQGEDERRVGLALGAEMSVPVSSPQGCEFRAASPAPRGLLDDVIIGKRVKLGWRLSRPVPPGRALAERG